MASAESERLWKQKQKEEYEATLRNFEKRRQEEARREQERQAEAARRQRDLERLRSSFSGGSNAPRGVSGTREYGGPPIGPRGSSGVGPGKLP